MLCSCGSSSSTVCPLAKVQSSGACREMRHETENMTGISETKSTVCHLLISCSRCVNAKNEQKLKMLSLSRLFPLYFHFSFPLFPYLTASSLPLPVIFALRCFMAIMIIVQASHWNIWNAPLNTIS